MAKDDLTTSLVNEPDMPYGLGGAWPLQFRNFIVRYLEVLFILVVALIVVAVFYYLPYKIAFLNFFYLPVLAAAYFLGQAQSRDERGSLRSFRSVVRLLPSHLVFRGFHAP